MNQSIHLIANSHIDPVWLWDRYEGVDEVINTFRSACDRLDEYPELCFTASSALFYRWVADLAPEVLSRIRQHVRTGRWEAAAGWLVEADTNLPLLESFRHSARISRRWLRELLDTDTPVAYSPDTFGHPAALPAVLTETGFRYYLFCRPGLHENAELPGDLFWWQYQGCRVLCQRVRYHYSQGSGADRQRLEQRLTDPMLLHHGMGLFMFGVGDHGGGPTKAEINTIQNLAVERPELGMRFSTCHDYFRQAETLPDIPTWEGDLHYHAVGCYSVNAAIKQAVRGCERILLHAERAEALSGTPADADADWTETVFHQFHDILPGSCSPEAADQALRSLSGVHSRAEQRVYRAVKTLSRRIRPSVPEGEFRIVNTLSVPVTTPLHIESFLYFRPGAPFGVVDGPQLPIQQVTPSVWCANRRWLFVDTLQPGEVRRYGFDTAAEPAPYDAEAFRYRPGNRIGYEHAQIAEDLIPCFHGMPILADAPTFGVQADSTDTWSHGVEGYDASTDAFTLQSCAVAEGPVAQSLCSRWRYHDSRIELTARIYAALPFIDWELAVFWAEDMSVLKLELPLKGDSNRFEVQAAGGSTWKTREGREEPLHAWVRAAGWGLVQDGAFACDRHNAKLRITLLRSSLYGYDQGFAPDMSGPLRQTDQGWRRFRLRWYTDDQTAPVEWDARAAAFLEPFTVIRENG